MGIGVKIRNKLAVAAISGNPSLTGNPTFSGTPVFSGNPTFSGTPTIGDVGGTPSFTAMKAPAGTTANGTANLPVAQAGFLRLSHNGATVQVGFVVDGTAYSIQGTAAGAMTLLAHS